MKKQLNLLYLMILLCGASAQASAAQAKLIAGPMPGHSALRSVSLWLQLDQSATVSIEYWPATGSPGIKRTPPVNSQAATRNTMRIDVDDLTPGTTYHYRIKINGKIAPMEQSLQFKTQPLWQWRTAPPPFSLVAGSCNYVNDPPFDRPGAAYGKKYQIFDAIADQQPDFMLWLGDNTYFRPADYASPGAMAARYQHTRSLPQLQNLLRSTHHYAVWDDHDYGRNNANHSFVHKGESLALFKRHWPNPSYGLPEVPGVFTRFRYHDVDFFLLDNRYYRNSDKAPDSSGKALFGPQQLHWLRDALLTSNAPFKIIANGGQLLNDHNRYEGWNHFPHERQAFLKWLQQTDIPGVMFLSGDRHHSELLKVDRPGRYPLYELTCSPLTAGVHDIDDEKDKPALVPGTLVGQRNFCKLSFSGPQNNRQLRMEVFDNNGTALWQHTLAADELTDK